MGAQVIVDRRALIGAALAGAGGLTTPAWAGPAPAAPQVINLPVGTRATKLFVWTPSKPRGVALFSHGHGSWPDRYVQLAAALMADGFAVLGPVHVDSLHYPERARFTLQQSFPERLADMAAAQAHAATLYPGLPTIAVGHSFGTLTALCLAGALAHLGKFRDPAVRAVLGFSTPGKIPGLVQPSAYALVATPVMIVTGTADTVPGFVTDPADHLLPAQTAPIDSFALVVQGADHVLVAGPAFARASVPVRLFLQGYGLDDRRARDRLSRWQAAPEDRFTFRKAQA